MARRVSPRNGFPVLEAETSASEAADLGFLRSRFRELYFTFVVKAVSVTH